MHLANTRPSTSSRIGSYDGVYGCGLSPIPIVFTTTSALCVYEAKEQEAYHQADDGKQQVYANSDKRNAKDDSHAYVHFKILSQFVPECPCTLVAFLLSMPDRRDSRLLLSDGLHRSDHPYT